MFCSQCGKQLPEGSKFCGECGAKIAAAEPVAEESPAPVVPVEHMAEEAPVIAPVALEVPVEPQEEEAPVPPVTKASKPKKKGGKGLLVVGIVLLVLVLLAAAAFAVWKFVLPRFASDEAYVYFSDGDYALIRNLNSDKVIDVASSGTDRTSSSLASFSPDGMYLYFFTDVAEDKAAGTLCRVEYDKLKPNSDKNRQYIEEIAEDVYFSFSFMENGALLYKTTDYALHYFNGEDSEKIAKDVSQYYIVSADKIAYVTGDSAEDHVLYGVVLDDAGEKRKLASNFDSIFKVIDEENILYVRDEDDYWAYGDVYVTGFNREAELLGERVDYLRQFGDKIYFIAEDGKTISLYAFVDDPYVETDAGIKEPNYEDYAIPNYRIDLVYGEDLSEDDFEELYTSCEHGMYWFGESTWWTYTMYDALELNMGEDTEAIRAAVQAFIDEFADDANEDGYIPVTEEVKAALQKINAAYADGEDWQWLWLCHHKFQDGTTTDWDAYDADWAAWEAVSDRIYMREYLQTPENSARLQTLYCYENGQLKTVAEDILNVELGNGAFVYNTLDMVTERVHIDDCTVYDLNALYAIFPDQSSENYVLLRNGSVVRMSADAAAAYANANETGHCFLYFTENNAYMLEDANKLYAAEIRGGEVGDFEAVAEKVYILRVTDTAIYYGVGDQPGGGINTDQYDFYIHSEGKAKRLAKDILLKRIYIYDDGAICAYTEFEVGSGYELVMIDAEGNKTRIGDEITQFVRVDESKVLYLSDGDLYVFDGGEKSKIASDVTYFWSKYAMKIAISLAGY